MAIIREEHKDNYSCIMNHAMRDTTLSYKARGILSYMLTCKDDWKFTAKSIASMTDNEGITTVRTGLIELEKKGYLKRTRAKKNHLTGRYTSDVEYTVFERCQNMDFYAERCSHKEPSQIEKS